jgi:arylsulfatase A
VQLFNVAEDIHEDHNLAAKHPERVQKMVALLRKQIDDGRSTPGPKLANGRDVIHLFPRVPKFVWGE